MLEGFRKLRRRDRRYHGSYWQIRGFLSDLCRDWRYADSEALRGDFQNGALLETTNSVSQDTVREAFEKRAELGLCGLVRFGEVW